MGCRTTDSLKEIAKCLLERKCGSHSVGGCSAAGYLIRRIQEAFPEPYYCQQLNTEISCSVCLWRVVIGKCTLYQNCRAPFYSGVKKVVQKGEKAFESETVDFTVISNVTTGELSESGYFVSEGENREVHQTSRVTPWDIKPEPNTPRLPEQPSVESLPVIGDRRIANVSNDDKSKKTHNPDNSSKTCVKFRITPQSPVTKTMPVEPLAEGKELELEPRHKLELSLPSQPENSKVCCKCRRIPSTLYHLNGKDYCSSCYGEELRRLAKLEISRTLADLQSVKLLKCVRCHSHSKYFYQHSDGDGTGLICIVCWREDQARKRVITPQEERRYFEAVFGTTALRLWQAGLKTVDEVAECFFPCLVNEFGQGAAARLKSKLEKAGVDLTPELV